MVHSEGADSGMLTLYVTRENEKRAAFVTGAAPDSRVDTGEEEPRAAHPLPPSPRATTQPARMRGPAHPRTASPCDPRPYPRPQACFYISHLNFKNQNPTKTGKLRHNIKKQMIKYLPTSRTSQASHLIKSKTDKSKSKSSLPTCFMEETTLMSFKTKQNPIVKKRTIVL